MILVVNGDYCGCQGGSDRRGLWGMEEGCRVAQVMWQIVKWKSMAPCSLQIQGWIEDKRLGGSGERHFISRDLFDHFGPILGHFVIQGSF